MDAQQRQQITDRIAEIDTVLAAGAATITIDGTTTSYSLAELRRERDALLSRLQAGAGKRRPVAYRPRLG